MFRLIVHKGSRRGRRLAIHGEEIVIGSAEDCPLRLVGRGVAARHARLEERAEGHVIVRLDAAAELRINGRSVSEHPLRAGDRIGIGEFELEYRPAADARHKATDAPHLRRRGGELAYALIGLFLVIQALLLGYLNFLFYQTQSPEIPPAAAPTRER
jgi:hypothetical protein